MRTWHFTDLEFVVAWEPMQTGAAVPEPFTYTCRTPDYDEYEREKDRTRQRLHWLDADIDAVLQALVLPDIRIVVTGWAEDSGEPKDRIRLLAARSGPIGCLVTQLPGETVWHSGGFTVAEHDPLALADAVAAALPQRQPGTLGRVVLESGTGELDYSLRRSQAHELTHDRELDRLQRYLRAPKSGHGTIRIIQGSSRYGPRGITRRTLQWRDLHGDGRYAIIGTSPPVATAVDTRRLTALINAEIVEVIRAIKDERS
ncbi:ESX secretion-associated protein EspG [Nocardia transvalensis]|uniref:ESX secretion-associated protein EspG n=1 Tax=Nocardia transvalensis TaxID=37333 RepID=UPI001895E4C4|nr:ESX secretion-associated protein EspG [Nocardia transvalensis]MBF6327528.1 ESX secretion-associated protein EspG [Nocardia transvalensis]